VTHAGLPAQAGAGPEGDGDLAWPQGCPSPHKAGYGQQTGTSFVRVAVMHAMNSGFVSYGLILSDSRSLGRRGRLMLSSQVCRNLES
jgi:hypothetical protein